VPLLNLKNLQIDRESCNSKNSGSNCSSKGSNRNLSASKRSKFM